MLLLQKDMNIFNIPSEMNYVRKLAFSFALAFTWCEWNFTLLKRRKVGRRKVRKNIQCNQDNVELEVTKRRLGSK